jgi:UDP-3-O-[3-hydroxymyristoyl] glucosamine N-acyltransferase
MLILEHCVRSIKVTGDTTIGEGTKIDNQVHVGHDTYWKKCLIASKPELQAVLS